MAKKAIVPRDPNEPVIVRCESDAGSGYKCGRLWNVGDVGAVTCEQAAYLIGTFPGGFTTTDDVRVGDPAPTGDRAADANLDALAHDVEGSEG